MCKHHRTTADANIGIVTSDLVGFKIDVVDKKEQTTAACAISVKQDIPCPPTSRTRWLKRDAICCCCNIDCVTSLVNDLPQIRLNALIQHIERGAACHSNYHTYDLCSASARAKPSSNWPTARHNVCCMPGTCFVLEQPARTKRGSTIGVSMIRAISTKVS